MASSITIPSGDGFSTIAVSGQSDLVADANQDTLTIAAGSNITLTTNASTDTLTIAASGGGGNPGGSDTQVQFNDSGSFGGDAGLVFNKTTNALTVAGNLLPVASAGSVGVANDPWAAVYANAAYFGEVVPSTPLANVDTPVVAAFASRETGGLSNVLFAAQSDGYAFTQIQLGYIAASGDVTPTGAAATAGTVYALGSMWSELNDPTDEQSFDFGLTTPWSSLLHSQFLAVNYVGDVSLGSITPNFGATPVTITDANLYIAGATGNTAVKGTLQAAGYKSSDGTAGATAGPFTAITGITVKNGLVVALTGT